MDTWVVAAGTHDRAHAPASGDGDWSTAAHNTGAHTQSSTRHMRAGATGCQAHSEQHGYKARHNKHNTTRMHTDHGQSGRLCAATNR